MVGASRGVHIIADTLRFHEQPDWQAIHLMIFDKQVRQS
jgi:hypothetical protein